MPTRTFLALDLDDAILDRLLAVRAKLDDGQSKISWIERANLHLTLSFLGDVPDDVLPLVCDTAAAVAGEVESFEMDIRGLTVTPPRGAPRMFWAEVADVTGTLARLQQTLSDGLLGLGLRQEDRAFHPHITLARIKFAHGPMELRRAAQACRNLEFGIQHVEELVAYSSELTREGPIYTPISRAKLGK